MGLSLQSGIGALELQSGAGYLLLQPMTEPIASVFPAWLAEGVFPIWLAGEGG